MELGRLAANGGAEVPGRRSIAGLLREAVGSIGPGLIDTSRHASVTSNSARGGQAGADGPNLITSDLTDTLTLVHRAGIGHAYSPAVGSAARPTVTESLSGTRRIVSNVAFVENI